MCDSLVVVQLKKCYIIIDYSIIKISLNVVVASTSSNISRPSGSDKEWCVGSKYSKVDVRMLFYDLNLD